MDTRDKLLVVGLMASAGLSQGHGLPPLMPTKYRRYLPKIPRVYEAKRNEPCPCGSGKKFKKCCAV